MNSAILPSWLEDHRLLRMALAVGLHLEQTGHPDARRWQEEVALWLGEHASREEEAIRHPDFIGDPGGPSARSRRRFTHHLQSEHSAIGDRLQLSLHPPLRVYAAVHLDAWLLADVEHHLSEEEWQLQTDPPSHWRYRPVEALRSRAIIVERLFLQLPRLPEPEGPVSMTAVEAGLPTFDLGPTSPELREVEGYVVAATPAHPEHLHGVSYFLRVGETVELRPGVPPHHAWRLWTEWSAAQPAVRRHRWITGRMVAAAPPGFSSAYIRAFMDRHFLKMIALLRQVAPQSARSRLHADAERLQKLAEEVDNDSGFTALEAQRDPDDVEPLEMGPDWWRIHLPRWDRLLGWATALVFHPLCNGPEQERAVTLIEDARARRDAALPRIRKLAEQAQDLRMALVKQELRAPKGQNREAKHAEWRRRDGALRREIFAVRESIQNAAVAAVRAARRCAGGQLSLPTLGGRP